MQDQPNRPFQPGTPDQPNRQFQRGTQDQPNSQFQPGTPDQPNRQFQRGTQDQPNRQFQPGTQDQPNRQFQPGTQDQPNRQLLQPPSMKDQMNMRQAQTSRQFQPPQQQQPQPSFNVQVQVKQFGDGAPAPKGLGCCSHCLVFLSVLLIIFTFPFSLIMCIKIVAEYERAVVFRLGRILVRKSKGPGLCFIIPCTDNWQRVDLRTVTFDVPPQEILSKDSVSATVDAVVYYKIFDPMMSVNNVADVNSSTRYLAQTTLRNVLGSKDLSEILVERELVSRTVLELLEKTTVSWGVKVERIEVKDVKIPAQMQRAMAAEAEAHREANANVIVAKGEWKASKTLRKAADSIADSPAAIQLRYLQTLNAISAENSSTIVFPLPMELLQAFGKGGQRRQSKKNSRLRAARRSEAEALEALRDSELQEAMKGSEVLRLARESEGAEGVVQSSDVLDVAKANGPLSPKKLEQQAYLNKVGNNKGTNAVAAPPQQSNDFATSQHSDLITPPNSQAATPRSIDENREKP